MRASISTKNRLTRTKSSRVAPLGGVKVLCVARLLPGAYCTKLLADLGAEIIMLEHPKGGDPMRLRPSFFDAINRGKKSITVDLRSDKGKEICYRLAEQAHVFIEGFRPGTAARLGIDRESVKHRNPGIIYVSISGFGQDGPYCHWPSHDLTLQAMAGMLAGQIGKKNSPFAPPLVPIADFSSAMYATIGILSALYQSRKAPTGRYIDISMLDGLLSWMSIWLNPGNPSGLEQSEDPAYSVFETKDGKYLALGIAHEDHFWQRLCQAIDRVELGGLPHGKRLEKHRELSAILRTTFQEKTRNEWMHILTAADIPVGPVYTTAEEVLADPHVRHREMVIQVDDPRNAKAVEVGSPLKSFRIATDARTRPPELGEATWETLVALGYNESQIKIMKKEGVI